MRNLFLIATFVLIGAGSAKADVELLQKDRELQAAPVAKVEKIELEEIWHPVDCEGARATNDERVCLACNIYHEARSEPEPGQYAVALVTHNRTRSRRYPNHMCDVVWEIRRHYKTKRRTPMFSWTLDGKPDKVHNQDKWQIAYSIAHSILETIEQGVEMADITKGALYYHANYVNPSWASKLVKTAEIGNHIFYTDPPKLASTK